MHETEPSHPDIEKRRANPQSHPLLAAPQSRIRRRADARQNRHGTFHPHPTARVSVAFATSRPAGIGRTPSRKMTVEPLNRVDPEGALFPMLWNVSRKIGCRGRLVRPCANARRGDPARAGKLSMTPARRGAFEEAQ